MNPISANAPESLKMAYADAATHAGKALLASNRSKEALQSLDNALKAYPGHEDAIKTRALAFSQIALTGDVNAEEALQAIEQALDLDANDPQLHMILGHLHTGLNRPDQAAEAYLAAADLIAAQAPK